MPNLKQIQVVACLGILLFQGGCRQEKVEVYEVPKEQVNPLAQFEPDHHLHWKTPAGWMEMGPGRATVASFRVVKDDLEASVTITPLPRNYLAGREMGLVNEVWRKQVGLEPVAEEELPKLAKTVAIGATDQGQLFDMVAEKPGDEPYLRRLMVAYAPKGNTIWYFKLIGEDKLVAGQAAAFQEFLKSITFDSSEHSNEPQWTVPSHWKQTAPPQFALAGFAIKSDQQEANLSISQVGGELLDNVNRWRQQLGLSPTDADSLAKSVVPVDVQGSKATLVELSGQLVTTGKPAVMVVILVPGGKGNWIYKMTGDPTLVQQEKKALIEFVQSAQVPHA